MTSKRGLRVAVQGTGRGWLLLGAMLGAMLAPGCSKENDVDQSNNVDNAACTTPTTDLAKLCPAGTSLDLTGVAAAGNPVCPNGEGAVKDPSGQTTGVCRVFASCSVRCVGYCPCGVKSATTTSFECAACPVCGDGKCEGNERASCEAGAAACVPCQEDCAGANCGDGVCNGAESAASCPQDCAKQCEPSSVTCAGNKVRKCSADGSTFLEIDCGEAFLCAGGECKKANSCGNGVCEPPGETQLSCPQDCATCGNKVCDQGEQVSCPQDCGVCKPGEKKCVGDMLQACNAQGTEFTSVDCAKTGQVCGNGQCQQANICGNGKCEGSESESCPKDCVANKCGNKVCDDGEQSTCPSDCAACGNKVCEAEEELTCPQDCATCGNKVCELGEQVSCPQDCGVCKPSAKECLGNKLQVCTANGAELQEFDCGILNQTCGLGKCVPRDECGNGACEANELETCPDDCASPCGDGACGPGESYETCSKDCAPVCGNQTCDLGESKAVCAQDCPVLCGNGTCDKASGETRQSCPVDCGYCGNGVCDPNAESSMLKPPAPLESCPNDCVKFTCTLDSECDDGIACTKNTCVNGSCAYVPEDTACGAAEVCLENQGCCADADNDGYPAISCGGTDCDDNDPLTHPGAIESCDGIDRNCSGDNKPALGAAVQITKDFAYKEKLVVVRGAGLTFAAWVGKPEVDKVLQYALVDSAGKMIGGKVFTADAIKPVQLKAAYSEQIDKQPPLKRFAVGWVDGASDFVRMDWVNPAGVLAGTPVELIDIKYFAEGNSKVSKAWTGFGWSNGRYLATVTEVFSYCSSFGCQNPGYSFPAVLATEEGLVSPVVNGLGIITGSLLDKDGSFLVVGQKYQGVSAPPTPAFQALKVDGTTSGVGDIASTRFTGQAVWDGELVASLGYDNATNENYFERIAPSGATTLSVKLPLKSHTPVAIAYAPGKTADDPGRSGLLTSQSPNYYFSARNQDGTEAIKPGQIVSDATITDPHLFWNGQSFVVVYLGTVKKNPGDPGIQQVFQATVQCK